MAENIKTTVEELRKLINVDNVIGAIPEDNINPMIALYNVGLLEHMAMYMSSKDIVSLIIMVMFVLYINFS